MLRWTTFFSHKDLKDENMILMCIWRIRWIYSDIYVEDILITESCIADIGSIKSSLHNVFSMTDDLGLLKHIFGLEIEKFDEGIKVIQ